MIGLAGCGQLGAPMLRALRDAGTDTHGFDVVAKPVSWIMDDPEEFARALKTLIIVVRDSNQILDLLFKDQKLVERATELQRIVVCTTVTAGFMAGLRRHVPNRVVLLDAPTAGTPDMAEDRKLSFLLGGEDEEVDALIPLLSSMGNAFYHMGPLGAGMQASLLNTMLAATHVAMTRLVLSWADAQHLDPDALLQLIADGPGENWFASNYDTVPFAKAGHMPDNAIGQLVRIMGMAIESAPDNESVILPQTVMTALRNLKPGI